MQMLKQPGGIIVDKSAMCRCCCYLGANVPLVGLKNNFLLKLITKKILCMFFAIYKNKVAKFFFQANKKKTKQ